jgi:hypothetical protein
MQVGDAGHQVFVCPRQAPLRVIAAMNLMADTDIDTIANIHMKSILLSVDTVVSGVILLNGNLLRNNKSLLVNW